MNYTVFYRTYRGDFKWLRYSLLSIKKFLKGYTEIVIVVPESDFTLLIKTMRDWECPGGIRVERCTNFKGDDYIGQQLSKLYAFELIRTEALLFVDSDIIFTADTSINQFMEHGLPCILKTPYTTLEGDVLKWKKATEDLMKRLVEYEYMRRMPLLYYRETLRNLVDKFKLLNNISLSVFLNNKTDRHFSEFNLIGAYSEQYEPENYYFLDTTKEELPPLNSKQFWSWSGLTDQEKIEIENLLK